LRMRKRLYGRKKKRHAFLSRGCDFQNPYDFDVRSKKEKLSFSQMMEVKNKKKILEKLRPGITKNIMTCNMYYIIRKKQWDAVPLQWIRAQEVKDEWELIVKDLEILHKK